MHRSLQNLGLAPDLLGLPSEVRNLILRGNRGQFPSHSEAATAVCAAMSRANCGIDELWVVLTDPANGISAAFFEKDGERAEADLERIVAEAHGVVNRGGRGDE